MPEPTDRTTRLVSPKHPFTAVGVALGWRHSAVVGRRGDQLVTGAAAVLTRQRHESQEEYVGRITDTATRYARVLGYGTVTAIAGMRLGAGGPRVRADLERLRGVHAEVHERLPDADAVTPVVGERADYPAALTRRPAPRWLRRANQHPTGDRAALRRAWDATAAAAGEPSPPPLLPTHVDRSGRIPAPDVPAGRPGGGGAPAGAGSAPRAGHPPWLADALTAADEGARRGDTAELPPPAPGDVPPELRDRLADLGRVFTVRGRDYAAARAPLSDALGWLAAEALAGYARDAARQRLPKRLSVTQRYDPRVLRMPRVDACRVEDLVYRPPRNRRLGRLRIPWGPLLPTWWLQHVRVGEGDSQQLEHWHINWRTIALSDLAKLPFLHRGKPRVVVLRGRHEPTRLALAAMTTGWAALAAVTGMWVVTHLAEIVLCLAALAVGLAVTGRRRRRRWWPRP